MWCETQNSLSFGLFFPFDTPPPHPPTTQQNKISKKWKKTLSYIIILHMCTINDDHMMYGEIWCMTDRFFFFFHVEPFSPFYPTSDHNKNQNFEKMKKNWKYYHFTHVYHKWQSYDVQFPRYETWWTEFFVTFNDFFIFCYFTHLTTQKIKIYKK